MTITVDNRVDRFRKVFTLIFLLFGAIHSSSAQNLDSLLIITKSKIKIGDYVEGLNDLLKLEVHFDLTTPKPNQSGEVYLLLANCYNYFDYKEKALDYYSKSYQSFKTTNDSLGMAMCLTEWGDLLEDFGYTDKAFAGFDFAEKYFVKIKDTSLLVQVYNNQSSTYENLGNYSAAFELLVKAMALSKSANDTNITITTYNNMGDVFRKQSQHQKAIVQYQKAIQLAQLSNNKDQKRAALKDISKSYFELGMFEQAYLTHVEFFELNSSLKTKKKIDEVTQLQLNVLESLNKSRIDELNRERNIAQFKLVVTIMALAAIALFLLGLLGAYRYKTGKEKELQITQQKLLESEMKATTLKNELIENELAINKQKLEEYTQMLITRGKENTPIYDANYTDNEFTDSIDKVRALDELSKSHLLTNEDWLEFKDKFELVFPQFFTKLREQYPDLSAGDIRLTVLLKLRLKNEEIANMMGISTDSVKKAKFRLKKKIAPIDNEFNIKNWVLNL